jgi:uncharacterized protein (TIGR02266 family)
MAQDTRKDPRAKVLSMTVRYKSATVDEFIEHHSHDVSRGGIFIKTPSPFPPGTLLKFEIRIQDEQSVLAGVGRVVWKRDAGEPGLESPAGMGVKFIKIDDKSKGLIQRLVESQPEGTASAFEAGKDGSGAGSDDVASDDATKKIENPAAAGAAVKPAAKRASTMLGLGSIGGSSKTDDKKDSASDAPAKDQGFFPRTNPEKEMPPPEERTVMKQAAELLKQALAEAGGSLDDLKDLQAPTKEEAKAAAAAAKEEAAKPVAKAEPAKDAEAKKDEAAKDAEAKKEKDDVKVEAVAVAVAAVAKAATKDEEPAAKPKAKEEPKAKPAEKTKPAAEERAVAAKPAPKPLMQEPEESGGSGKMLTILLVVAGLGAAAWLLFGRTDTSSTTGAAPENTAPTAMTAPVPTMTAAPVPTMTAAPVPTMTAAPTATASAAASASSSAAATPSAAPTATAAAAVKTAAPEAPKPPTVVAPPPTPKPPVVNTPPADKPKPVVKPKANDDPYG